jgi:hypothetical protein
MDRLPRAAFKIELFWMRHYYLIKQIDREVGNGAQEIHTMALRAGDLLYQYNILTRPQGSTSFNFLAVICLSHIPASSALRGTMVALPLRATTGRLTPTKTDAAAGIEINASDRLASRMNTSR